MTLTIEQRRTRAAAIVAETERTGCDILVAIRRVNSRMFGETAPAGKAKKGGGKKALRETLKAAQTPTRRPATVQPAGTPSVPQAPARPLHKMTSGELAETAADAYRTVSGSTPFWESAPPGVQQGPAGAVVPTVLPPAIPPPDPAAPLHNMSSEDWEAASAAWFADAARAGHPSPFWQAG